MIIIYHDYKSVIRIESTLPINFKKDQTIVEILNAIASKHPSQVLCWCHIDLEQFLNKENLSGLMAHSKIMFSFRPSNTNYLPNSIGYVDESPFININKKVRYPTWQMSSSVGIVSAEVVNSVSASIPKNGDFDYYLHSLAKTTMPLGLLCYSEPKLLKSNAKIQLHNSSSATLFKFVKQHYKTRWIFILLFNFLLYEKKFPFLPFFISLFYKNINSATITIGPIELRETNEITETETIDVIIPTIGRKKYLYDVLLDLKSQTHLPKKVIIVEQNPLPDSTTELDYIQNENWPFEIKHIFTHQTGACQARNKALAEVTSKWVFFNDDDNRFKNTLLKDAITNLVNLKLNCIVTSYPQINEQVQKKAMCQIENFGSGNAFLKAKYAKRIDFNLALEFGYGEDTEYGLQLRNQGIDVIYIPSLNILHLKAPMGGFRTRFIHLWESDLVQPKPSPTIMYVKKRFKSSEQILGYKTILFFKNYKNQQNKNPLNYYFHFKKQWNQSVLWATKLKNK